MGFGGDLLGNINIASIKICRKGCTWKLNTTKGNSIA